MEKQKRIQIKRFLLKVKQQRQLFIIFLIPFLYYVIFHYIPMYGVSIAFKQYKPGMSIFEADWVGFKHFIRFFKSYEFERVLKNTLGISFYSLIAGLPMPIILAIALNEMKHIKFKKFAQLVTYAPHFISEVVMVGMIISFLSPATGVVNTLIEALGGEAVNFMGEPKYFKSIYVWTGIWQNAGWGSIIYLSALSGVDPSLYESAKIDGASRLQKIRYIDLPCISPTIITLLLINLGRIMNVGFQKVLLMQNSLNMPSSSIIQTYTYEIGLIGGQYSYSAAIGLFSNIVNLILIVSFNRISKKLNGVSLW